MLKTFCENTSLHGFSYFVQPTRHRVEKIFWFLVVVISFILTGLLIRKLIIENQNNPIIIYKDQSVVKIQELNFPAISICPGMIYKTDCETHIDYKEIKSQLMNHERNITDLNMMELKMMQVLSLVARDGFISENFPSLKIPMDDYMDIFNIFNQTFATHFLTERVKLHRPIEHMLVFNFQAVYAYKYAMFIKHSATQYGPCFTLNLPEPNEIYNVEKTDPDLYNGNVTELFGYKRNQEYEKSRIKQMELSEYPVKASLETLEISHYELARPCMEKVYMLMRLFRDIVPEEKTNGFHISIHDPYDIISSSARHFIWNWQDRMELLITPELTRIDESLIDESPEYRNCYLSHERQLEFFKVYSKSNCEHECWVKMTLESCGCVQFFMARNKTTKVCGTNKEKCVKKVQTEFEENIAACKCYDPCNNLKYEISLVSTEHYGDPGSIGTTVSTRFSVDSVYATRRKLSHTAVDFLSFIGGLLGLFAGFSFLSSVEIIYYFLVVPLRKLRKQNDTRVHPMVEIEVSQSKIKQIWHFMRQILDNSSIHSFNLIGGDEKTIFERLLLLILFVTSMGTACWMMKDVFDAFRKKQIIMKYGSDSVDLTKIPLPAMTIVREHSHGWNTLPQLLTYYGNKYGCVRATRCPKLNRTYVLKMDYEHKSLMHHIPRKDFFEFEKPGDYTESLMANILIPASEFYVSTLWNENFQYTNQDKLLNNDSISDDFRYKYEHSNNLDFPLKASIGEKSGLYLFIDERDRFGMSWTDKAYLIHSPFELPIYGFREGIKESKVYDIFVAPNVIKAEEGLKSLNLDNRKCYFDNERKLNFFKIYTQNNCELECLAYVIDQVCTCVPFYYIRDPKTWVCNSYSVINCVDQLGLLIASDYDYLFKSHGVCNCLPQCNSVQYSYEIVKSEYYPGYKYQRNIVTMKWKDSQYYPMIRIQEFKLTDFFSFAGGILGLFAGISVLSMFEIFYFITLRLATDFVRFFKQYNAPSNKG